jgi:hypothetical protein
MSTLLIKYATRSRPHRMFAVLDSIFNNAENPKDIILLLTWDKDDKSTYNPTVIAKMKPYLEKYNIKLSVGDRVSKVEAFNRDIDTVKNWDYLLHLTDFTEICQKGFDTDIQKEYELLSGSTGMTSLNLQSINGDGRTHHHITLIPYSFYKNHGFLYNPKLKANFDREELEFRCGTTSYSRLFTAFPKVYRYIHPKWLYYNPDNLLIDNASQWKQDLETFESLTNEH